MVDNFESRFKINLMKYTATNDIDVADIDELTASLIESATLFELYNESDYIHINIPTGNDAIAQYIKIIRYVDNIVENVDINDICRNKPLPNPTQTYLNAVLNYFKDIERIYNKTDFVISNSMEIEDLPEDNDAIHQIFISSKEKYLLSKAIDKIEYLVAEIEKWYDSAMENYYKNGYEYCKNKADESGGA